MLKTPEEILYPWKPHGYWLAEEIKRC